MKRLLKSSLVLLSLTGAQYLYDWGLINTAKADPTADSTFRDGSEVTGQGRIENSGDAFVGTQVNLTGPTKLQFSDYESGDYSLSKFEKAQVYSDKYAAADRSGYYKKGENGVGLGTSDNPYDSFGTQLRKLEKTTLKGITDGKTTTVTVLTNQDGTLNTIGQRLFGVPVEQLKPLGLAIAVDGDTVSTDEQGYTLGNPEGINAKNGHRIVANNIQIAKYDGERYTLTQFGKKLFGEEDVTVDLAEGTVKVADNQVLKKYGSSWFHDDADPATTDYSSSAIFKINQDVNGEDETSGVAEKGIYIEQAVLAQMDEEGTLKATKDAELILGADGISKKDWTGLAGTEITVGENEISLTKEIDGEDVKKVIFKKEDGEWKPNTTYGADGTGDSKYALLTLRENVPHVTIAVGQAIATGDGAITENGKVLLNVEDQPYDDLSDTTTKLVLSDDTGRMPDETKRYFIEKLGVTGNNLTVKSGSLATDVGETTAASKAGYNRYLTPEGLELFKKNKDYFEVTDTQIKIRDGQAMKQLMEVISKIDTGKVYDYVKDRVIIEKKKLDEKEAWYVKTKFNEENDQGHIFSLLSWIGYTYYPGDTGPWQLNMNILDPQERFDPHAFNLAFGENLDTSKMYQEGNTYEYDLKVATYSAQLNDFGRDYFAWLNKKVNDAYSVDTEVENVEGHTSGDLHNYGVLHVFSDGKFGGAGTVYNYGQWKAIDSVKYGADSPKQLNLPKLENLTDVGGELTGDGYAADVTDKSLAREKYDYSKLSADELSNAAAYFDLYNDSGIREFRDHSMAEVRFYDKPFAADYQNGGLPSKVGGQEDALHEDALGNEKITLTAIIKTNEEYGQGNTPVGDVSDTNDTVGSRMPNFKAIDEELDPYQTNEKVAYDLTKQNQLDVKVTKRSEATDQFVKGAFFTQKGLPTKLTPDGYGKGEAIAYAKYKDSSQAVPIYESTEGTTQKIIQAAKGTDVDEYRTSVITTNSDFETFPEMGDSGTGATWETTDPVVTYTGDNSYFNGTFELKDGGAILAEAGTMFGGETILHQGTEFEWHGGPKDGLNRPHIKLQPFSTLYFNLNDENKDSHTDNPDDKIFSFYGTIEHADFGVNDQGQIATQYAKDGNTPTDEVYYTNGTDYITKAEYDEKEETVKDDYYHSWYYDEEAPKYYVVGEEKVTTDATDADGNANAVATVDDIKQTSRIVFESGKILIKGNVSGFQGNVYVGPKAGFEARIQTEDEAKVEVEKGEAISNIYEGALFGGHVYQDTSTSSYSIGGDGTLVFDRAAIFDSAQMTNVLMKNGYSILHNNTDLDALVTLDAADLDSDAVLEVQGESQITNTTIRGTMILNGDSTQTNTTIAGGVLVLGNGSTLTTHNMRVGSTVVMWNGNLDAARKIHVAGDAIEGREGSLRVEDDHTMKIFIDVDPSKADGQNADQIDAPSAVSAVATQNHINIGGLNFITYDMTADEYLFTVLTGGAENTATITIGAEYDPNNPTFVAYENAGFTTKAGRAELSADTVYQYTADKNSLNVERQADGSYIIYFSNGAEYQLFGSHGDNGAGAGKIKLVALGSGYMPIDVMHTAGLGNTADLFQRITSEWGFDEKTETERHFWNRSFIGRTTHAAKTGYSDLKSTDYGTVFGYDWKDIKLQRANAKFYPSLFASVTHSNFKGSDQSARQETYALGAKGTWYNTKFKLDMMGTYEFLNTHSNSVENGRKVKSHIGGFGIKGAYNLFEKRGYTLRPEFLVDYSYINTKDVKISDTRKLKFKNINRFDIVPGLSLLQEIGTWKNALSFKYHQKLGGKAKVIAKTDKVVDLDELKKSHFEASVDINKLGEKSKLGIQLSKTFGGHKGLKGTVKFGYRFQ